jgi:hypothetical protein
VGSANVKVQNIFHGRNNITCSTNCNYRTAAPPYTLETWFVCFKYIIVNTLHKGDNKDTTTITITTTTTTTTTTNNNNNAACRVLGLVICSCLIKSPTQMSFSSAQRATCSFEGGSEDRVTAV